jgi:hypothetical protein
LLSSDGCVLKPALDRKGQREIEVYERIFDNACNDIVLLSLRKFVPKYLGIWTTPVHPGRKYCCGNSSNHSFIVQVMHFVRKRCKVPLFLKARVATS